MGNISHHTDPIWSKQAGAVSLPSSASFCISLIAAQLHHVNGSASHTPQLTDLALFSCNHSSCTAQGVHAYLHGVHYLVFCVQSQFDSAMCTPAQIFDDEVLVDKHIALRGAKAQYMLASGL